MNIICRYWKTLKMFESMKSYFNKVLKDWNVWRLEWCFDGMKKTVCKLYICVHCSWPVHCFSNTFSEFQICHCSPDVWVVFQGWNLRPRANNRLRASRIPAFFFFVCLRVLEFRVSDHKTPLPEITWQVVISALTPHKKKDLPFGGLGFNVLKFSPTYTLQFWDHH